VLASVNRACQNLVPTFPQRLDQAAPLDNWRLADCVHRLRRTHGSADEEARDERRLRVLQQQQSVAESVAALKAKKVYSEKIRVRGLTGPRGAEYGAARRNHL
jgi:hypothetical protein